MRSADTSPDAERVQIELLRQAGPARRFALACSLTRTTLRLSRGAIARANPGASRDELAVRFVELCYGHELAEGFRRFLEVRAASH